MIFTMEIAFKPSLENAQTGALAAIKAGLG
jgi:hypothetical protein